MSEFLAEAQVLITPNTAGFRAQLQAELLKATKGLTVPIPVVAVSGATGAVQKAADTATKKSIGSKAAATRATELLARAEEQLAGVEKAALLGTSQLSAARIRLSKTSAAVVTAERALAAAVKSKNAVLIEDVEATLALAQADQIRARAAARTILLANAQTAALEREAAAAAKVAKSQVASAQVSGALSQQAKATTAAASASRLLAQAELQLSEVEAVAALKTTALAAARARLSETSAATATAARAVQAAEASGNAALIAATRNTLALAEAQELQFQTAVKSTIASSRLAAAEAKQAASSAQATRGAGATALSMAGARGATLAASSSFLIGAAAAVFFAESIKQATDAEEVFRRTTILLGSDLANQLSASSQNISQAFGIDDEDVLRFQVQVGQIFKVVGFADAQTVEFSENIVKLAADMAAFAGVPVAQTLKAIQGGLAGNTRGLKTYGILMSNAAVQQLAMEQTGKKNADQLTRQELVLARYTLILRDASFQQGAFAAQAGSLTGQSKILRVNFENLQETIGKGLVPAVTGLVKGLNESFDAFNAAADGARNLGSALPIVGDSIGGVNVGGFVEDIFRLNTKMILLGPVFGPASLAIDKFAGSTKAAGKELDIFDKIAGGVAATLGSLSNAFEKASVKLPSAADILGLNIAVAQAEGDQGTELAGLRQQEAAQESFLERILARPQSQKNIALAKKAASQLENTRNQIQSILDGIASDEESAASKRASDAQAASRKAEDARRKADDAFLNFLGGKRGRAENLLLRAEGTESLKDDIRLTEQFADLIRQQIEQVRKRVKDAQAKTAAIRTLTTLLIQTTNEGKRLAEEQRQALKDAAATRLDKAQTGIELDIELADINDATSRRIALRQKLVTQLLKERRVLKLTGNALKENRNEIARINAEIAGIKGESKKTGDGFSALAFDFLQKQQGFAANLLGNLIPGSATAGLVGGTTPAPPTPASGLQAQAAFKTASPTYGQAATEVDILKQVLQVLREIQRGRAHPEAAYQRATSNATMDFQGGV